MKIEEEAKMWEALALLTKAEYLIGAIAAKAKEEQVFRDFEKAMKKIREAEVLITPLLKKEETKE